MDEQERDVTREPWFWALVVGWVLLTLAMGFIGAQDHRERAVRCMLAHPQAVMVGEKCMLEVRL